MAAYTVTVTSAGIQILGSSGTVTTLTLPTGVSLTNGPASVARLGNRLIVTGCVNVPIWLGSDLTLRVLALPTPTTAPTLTATTGTYTGTRMARVSYLLRDTQGNILAESPLGPISAAVQFTAQGIVIGNLPIPNTGDPVTDRRIYLTPDSQQTFFLAFDVQGITTTSVTTSIADGALSLVAAPVDNVAAPADIALVTVWKNRLWARSQADVLVGTTPNRLDQWTNAFPVDQGIDGNGLTGFLPRRDEFGIGRRDRVWKLTGTTETDFALVKLIDGKGIIASQSCLVIRDVGYFLSDDGVYAWDANGVNSLTDATVRPWFTTDGYFARALFNQAFAGYDPVLHRYNLYLPAVGSTVINRWISLDISTGKWFGPHLTTVVASFTGATIGPDANNVNRLILGGSDGFLYAPIPGVYTDGASTAISFDAKGKPHSGYDPVSRLYGVNMPANGADDPDIEHLWLRPSIFTAIEAGGTLTITPYVGGLGATASATLSHDLTQDREALPRIGNGRLCQLEMTEATAGQAVHVYGYELPFRRLGRR